MIFMELIKFIAELITSIAAASIVVIQLIKLCNPIKKYFRITVPEFFAGYTDEDGKKIRFFKGIKRQREQDAIINKALAPDFKTEEVLVLDKEKLLDIISNSDVFHTIRMRKK
jgi:hypothetical protein